MNNIVRRLRSFAGHRDALRREGARCLLLGIFDGNNVLLECGREIDRTLARRGNLQAVVTRGNTAKCI